MSEQRRYIVKTSFYDSKLKQFFDVDKVVEKINDLEETIRYNEQTIKTQKLHIEELKKEVMELKKEIKMSIVKSCENCKHKSKTDAWKCFKCIHNPLTFNYFNPINPNDVRSDYWESEDK